MIASAPAVLASSARAQTMPPIAIRSHTSQSTAEGELMSPNLMHGWHGPGREGGLRAGPPGRWWNDARLARELNLTAEQQKRMDQVFLQSRLKLIDLTATLQKEELTLEPLLAVDHPDAPRVFAQIDRIAQARAELEKVNGRMLFGLRDVLTVEQWKQLQEHVPVRSPFTPGGSPH